jgi:hypothetical protein
LDFTRVGFKAIVANSIDLAISLYASATASHAMAGDVGVTTAIAQNAAGFDAIA